jgi:hypothetical protein
MALLYFKFNLSNKYKLLFQDILKYMTVFIVFQYMMSSTKFKIKNPLTNGFLNDSMMMMLLYIVLGLMTYYLIIDEIISIV